MDAFLARFSFDRIAVGRAEDAEFRSNGNLVEEYFFLIVRVLGDHQDGFRIERRKGGGGGGFYSGCDPAFVFTQQVPNRVEQRRFGAFEIEMQDNERPLAAIAVRQGLRYN